MGPRTRRRSASAAGYRARRISGDGGMRGDVAGDNRTGADNGPLADTQVTKNNGARTDAGALSYDRGLNGPVCLVLQGTVVVGSAGMFVVNEGYAMTDEYFVLDGHPFADKSMA